MRPAGWSWSLEEGLRTNDFRNAFDTQVRVHSCHFLHSAIVSPCHFLHSAMPVVLGDKLCLGDFAIPMESRTLDWIDPYGFKVMVLHGGAYDESRDQHPETLEVNLIDFKATGNNSWIDKGLGLPYRWYLNNHGRTCGK